MTLATTHAPTVSPLYVLTIHHRHGANLSAHDSRAEADRAAADYAREWWAEARAVDDSLNAEPPDDDVAASEQYFNAMAWTESCSIDECEYGGDVALTPTPVPTQLDAVVAEFQAQLNRQHQAQERARVLALVLLVDVIERRLPEMTHFVVSSCSDTDHCVLLWAQNGRTVDEVQEIEYEIGLLPTVIGMHVWKEIGVVSDHKGSGHVVRVDRLRDYTTRRATPQSRDTY